MSALKDTEVLVRSCHFLQLCYDGRIIDKSDGYVFLGQFFNITDSKREAVTAVKSFL